MDLMALGNHKPFPWWSEKPRAWGPQGAWRAWLGGNVITGLCDVIDEHLAVKRRGVPAAIGCVPWLTDGAVADRLLALSAVCVVIDKWNEIPGRLNRLLKPDKGFPNIALSQLRGRSPSINGSAPLIGPWDDMPDYKLGPIRKLGYNREWPKPLPHIKVLVLGHLAPNFYGPDEDHGEEVLDFEPRALWLGSANWTRRSRQDLDFGVALDDPALVNHFTEFVADLIAFSEPVDSTCAGPEPNLVPVEFDHASMAEAQAEMAALYDDPEDW